MNSFNIIPISNDIKEKLNTPFPSAIYKTKDAGKNQLTYVAGQSVIDKLNSTFGYFGWSWEILDKFIQESEDKIIKYEWKNGIKKELEEPIHEKQLPVAHVIGKLTVHVQDENGNMLNISKTAPGAQCIIGGQAEQENVYKGANTDALKKAATMFGIGLELYRDENEEYFFQQLIYENPWTQEELEKHKESLDYINELSQSMSLDTVNKYLNAFSSGVYSSIDYLTPDIIDNFVDFLKNNIKVEQ